MVESMTFSLELRFIDKLELDGRSLNEIDDTKVGGMFWQFS